MKIFVAYNDRSRLSSGFIENVNKTLKNMGKDSTVSFSEVDFNISEGFVIIQGKYQIDVSLKNMLDMKREDLEKEIVEKLFKQ